jgi:hypothetical protein
MDVLQSIVAVYNWRDHSSIGMPPAKVTVKDVLTIWKRLQERHEEIRTAAPKFSEGKHVCISKQNVKFIKSAENNFSKEIFQISVTGRIAPLPRGSAWRWLKMVVDRT